MDSRAQEMSSQGQDDLAGEVMNSLGESNESANEIPQGHESEGSETTGDPLYVQKRLKQQKRVHERETRELHARIAALESQGSRQTASHDPTNPYDDGMGNHAGGIDEQIHKAVSVALRHKEMEEAKAKQAEQAAHVHKQYQDLHKHLDSVADKYDDFDDVVRDPSNAAFTTHMRDAALFLPKSGPGSAGEVLYKLGKNPEELSRISRLHPLDQASEMVKLSHALTGGGDHKSSSQPRTLGQVKTSPVNNSHAITDKTPVSSIRERMKAGSWK